MGTCSKPSFKQSAFKKKKGNQDFYGKKNYRAGNFYFGDAYKYVSFSSLHHVALKKDTK